MIHRLLPILCLLVSGCNVAGALAYKVAGQKVDPAYVPVKTDPMLVIAESYRGGSAVTVDTDQLARMVTDEIDRFEIAPVIDSLKVMDLRGSNPTAFRKLTISEIGHRFGAKQVLYINVIDSGIEHAGANVAMRGQAMVKVKIIDVETTQARWPGTVADGQPVNASTAFQEKKEGVSESSIRVQLQESLALQIGRLFRTYYMDE